MFSHSICQWPERQSNTDGILGGIIMDTNRAAAEILAKVGGKENVQELTHCFTRLRFVLKDMSKADKEVVEHLEGVIQVVIAGGQFQVVLGAKVTKVYDAMLPMLDLDPDAQGSAPQGNWLDRLLQIVSKIWRVSILPNPCLKI